MRLKIDAVLQITNINKTKCNTTQQMQHNKHNTASHCQHIVVRDHSATTIEGRYIQRWASGVMWRENRMDKHVGTCSEVVKSDVCGSGEEPSGGRLTQGDRRHDLVYSVQSKASQ